MVSGRTLQCLDEETIAAFVSSGLPAAELSRVEAHLAQCDFCRGIVADAAYGAIAISEQAPAALQVPAPASKPWAAFVPSPGTLIADKYRIESMLGHGRHGSRAGGAPRRARTSRCDQDSCITTARAPRPVSCARRRPARASPASTSPACSTSAGSDGEPYIVMEYLEGEDLLDELAARGPPPIAEAVDYVLQACEALAEAHAPASCIAISSRRTCSSPGGRRLRRSSRCSTSASRSWSATTPQAWRALTRRRSCSARRSTCRRSRSAPRSDVDARTRHLVARRHPLRADPRTPPFWAPTFSALCVAIATEPAPFPSSLRQDVPAPLADLIMRCLAKDRADRIASAAELMASLAPFASYSVASRPVFAAAPQPTGVAPVTGESAVISQANQTIPGLPSRRRSAVVVVGFVLATATALLAAGAVVFVRARALPVPAKGQASMRTGIAAPINARVLPRPPVQPPANRSAAGRPVESPPAPAKANQLKQLKKKRAEAGPRPPVGPTDSPD